MLRLNQNQRIQALTMLARGDNVSNVCRTFGCHRNTIIRLRQRFLQTGGVVVAPPQPNLATHSTKEALCGKSAYSTSSGCPFAVGTTAFSLGRQQWARVLFSNESRFNRSHHDGRIRVLEEEGNVLLIVVSVRGTDLEVGVLWYGVALLAEGKQISLLCKATSMLKVTLTRFGSLKLFLSFRGMCLQY